MLSFECIKNEKSVYFLLTSANRPKRGQKEGQVVPKVVNREPIFGGVLGSLFSPLFPRFGLWQFDIV